MAPAPTPPPTSLQLSTVENSKIILIKETYFKGA